MVGKQSECANHTTDEECCNKYRQREEKADGRYSSTLAHRKGGVGTRYNSLVLMREDKGLPEPSLDDCSTAELSGLKSTCGRRLEISVMVRSVGITRTSFNLSNIWTVVSQSTHASVMLTPYLSPEGPDAEKWVRMKEGSGVGASQSYHPREHPACQR